MSKKPENHNKKWNDKDINNLKELVDENTPTRIIALKLHRTPEAIYSKAQKEELSLKPTNQSPYNRKK